MVGKPVAIVTGGSKGLGHATALLLAERGWRIVLGSRAPEQAAAAIAAATGAVVEAVPGDLAAPETTPRLIAAAAALGRLDALLLNHGGPPVLPFMEIGEEAWAQSFELMVQAPLRLLRAAVPLLRAAGGGRVVAVSSFTAKAPYPGIVLSNSLRAALINALRTAAQELGPENILINALGPGYFATERIAAWNESYAAERGTDVAAVAEAAVASVPLRRYGQPRDYAEMAAFLMSPSNGYVTGQHILIDGGLVVAN